MRKPRTDEEVARIFKEYEEKSKKRSSKSKGFNEKIEQLILSHIAKTGPGDSYGWKDLAKPVVKAGYGLQSTSGVLTYMVHTSKNLYRPEDEPRKYRLSTKKRFQ
jgi:hypothetical protein